MMHGIALLAASTLGAAPPVRVSLNSLPLPVISDVNAGTSLWGGAVVLKNNPPPVLAGAVIHRTSIVSAAPAGALFRVTCETPPCDVYVSVYHNQCEGESEQFGLFRQLSAAGWESNACSLVAKGSDEGTHIHLPIKKRRVTQRITEFNLAEDSSRVLVFVRTVTPGFVAGADCPFKPLGPFIPNLQHCPGLPALPVNAVRPPLGSRVLQVEQDGAFLSYVTPIVGAGTVQDVVSIDQWGNVKSGFEVDQSSILTFYQTSGTDAISLIWVTGKDERAPRLGDQHKFSSAITGLPQNAFLFSTDSKYASHSYQSGVQRFVSDFPVERSVGAVYQLPEGDDEIVASVGPYELNKGLFLRVGGSADLIPVKTDRPFKIVTVWL